jgi:hypothetical protein
MAVTEITLDSIVSTKYQTGTTPAGGPVTQKKSLNYVKPTATSQDIYDVVAALSSLSQYPLLNVVLSKNWELTNE